jgi:hypothetical protein
MVFKNDMPTIIRRRCSCCCRSLMLLAVTIDAHILFVNCTSVALPSEHEFITRND